MNANTKDEILDEARRNLAAYSQLKVDLYRKYNVRLMYKRDLAHAKYRLSTAYTLAMAEPEKGTVAQREAYATDATEEYRQKVLQLEDDLSAIEEQINELEALEAVSVASRRFIDLWAQLEMAPIAD